MPRFHVRISDDDLTFSASHFLVFGSDKREPLHGHDYRVAAEVHGPLDENHYVVDFIVLHDALRAIIRELRHRVLLPTKHPALRVEAGRQEVEVTFGQSRWVFPRSDCVLLPIPNTTTELLARYVGQRLLDQLASYSTGQPEMARIEIDEGHGRSAICELQGWGQAVNSE